MYGFSYIINKCKTNNGRSVIVNTIFVHCEHYKYNFEKSFYKIGNFTLCIKIYLAEFIFYST